jgi:hypothetical protein
MPSTVSPILAFPPALAAALLLIVSPAVGCSGDGAGVKDSGDSATDDTGEGGGGGGVQWRPTGSGVAYFADGTTDNSLFHLEMSRVIDPEEGTAYYGFVSKGGVDPIAVGAITPNGEEVSFEADIGENAIIEGYDTFEAWANADGTQGSGEQLWAGQVDPVIYGVVQNLLIASTDTPDGQGSLRSVESAVEDLRDFSQSIVDAPPDLTEIRRDAEGITNAIRGEGEDLDADGTVTVHGSALSILGDAGYINLILSDLDAVAAQVEPTDPIREDANRAYDCTQAIEAHARNAALDAEVTSAAAAEATAMTTLGRAIDELGYALDGQDTNGDGTVDAETEGTIECAVLYVSEMAEMSVTTP